MQQLSGFLLTRHWRDTADGIQLSFWAHTDEGPLRLQFQRQQAVCFIPQETVLSGAGFSAIDFERRPLALQTLEGEPVDGLYFSQQRQLQQLRQLAGQQDVMLYESDLKPSDRFLMERFISGGFRASGELIRRPNHLEMHHPRLQPDDILPRLSYLSLDIETDGIDGEIISIAYCGAGREAILLQGRQEQWPSDLPIHWYGDEKALLRGFLDHFSRLDPDLILGWNLINFDLDYLQRRCHHHRIPFRLGRGGETATILQPQQAGQQRIASIPGRVALDGIDNLRAAFWRFDSFALDEVAQQLLGRGKRIDHKQDRVEEIRRLFRQDRPALAAYNLEDCRLVEAIFQHTELIPFCIRRAAMTGLTLGRQGGSVAAFDNLYLPRLHRAGVVAHDIGNLSFDTSSPGGYVMDSRPGLYHNVLVLDFKSLYPSIIRTFRIDPLGMARPGVDPIPGFLDASFSRQESILPDIITRLWEQRDQARQQGDQPLSQAIKIIMNSFYGVLGSSGCRFYNPKLASSITRRGHQIITRSRDRLETWGHPVIYGDTDSLFVLLGPEYDEAAALERGQKLARQLNLWWQEEIQRKFHLESFLEIEFETHFIRFLMPTIRGAETGSKKRYAGTVRSKNGALQVRFKGLESVRSDWTPLARRFQQELYRRIFFDEPYADYIRRLSADMLAGRLDDELIYRKRLRRPLESYQKNVPPHVQAARKASRPGRWISYYITVNGPEPADDRHSPIDYQHYLERQLAPSADGILHFLDTDFATVSGDQLALF